MHFGGLHFAPADVATCITFSTERAGKNIRWGQSKRLQQGTLVALSTERDMFSSMCKLAVIAARPIKGGLDQNPPQVSIFWGNAGEDAVFDPSECALLS